MKQKEQLYLCYVQLCFQYLQLYGVMISEQLIGNAVDRIERGLIWGTFWSFEGTEGNEK